MNINIKNLIALFFLVTCALTVSCGKLKGRYIPPKTYKYSMSEYYNEGEVPIDSEEFKVEVTYSGSLTTFIQVDELPKGVYCRYCGYENKGYDVWDIMDWDKPSILGYNHDLKKGFNFRIVKSEMDKTEESPMILITKKRKLSLESSSSPYAYLTIYLV